MRARSFNSLVVLISAGASAVICMFSMSFAAVLESIVIERLGFLSLCLAIITGGFAGAGEDAEGVSTRAILPGLIFDIFGALVLGSVSFALMYFSLEYHFSIEVLLSGSAAALALLFGFAAGFMGCSAIATSGRDN